MVEDAKALNVANKQDIAKALGISSQQLSHLLKGRDDWRATYIDRLCAVTKQHFSWPQGKQAKHNRIHLMLSELISDDDEWSSAVRMNIEALHEKMVAEKQRHPLSKAAG